MTATYTFDVFASLDGYANHTGDWGGCWGKAGPEFLQRRFEQYSEQQRIVFGATTYRFNEKMATVVAPEMFQEAGSWLTELRQRPATVLSNTLQAPLDWPDATVATGDAVEIIARLKEESDVPLRSHGSLALNRALLAAGLVDRIQLTVFPVLTGKTGVNPVFADVPDFDLTLIESHILDGSTQELVYQPTLH
ncbi:dihydrofolate reductase family protein [Kribbella sp. NPDC056861]|uniref:dihydrofolate reductase family protein n=1 Tax=Kribbella sp. NPDC056861 TaxID=3154857 RepID=UPI00342A4DDF